MDLHGYMEKDIAAAKYARSPRICREYGNELRSGQSALLPLESSCLSGVSLKLDYLLALLLWKPLFSFLIKMGHMNWNHLGTELSHPIRHIRAKAEVQLWELISFIVPLTTGH